MVFLTLVLVANMSLYFNSLLTLSFRTTFNFYPSEQDKWLASQVNILVDTYE